MGNIHFSVIITTLNRPDDVIRLVRTIERISSKFNFEILIVNSGTRIASLKDLKVKESITVKEFLVFRRNQPYQRSFGSERALGYICVFLDDDLRIVRDTYFDDIWNCFFDEDLAGVGVGYVNEGQVYVKEPSYPDRRSAWRSNLKYLEFGRIPGDCGIGGREPLDLTNDIMYVNALVGGNTPACRREYVGKLWDERIFRLADKGMGKGEDKYFTLALAKFGRIRYLNDVYVEHPSNTSTYVSSYRKWRNEVLRTRFLICDRYSEIFELNKTWNRFRLLLGTLLSAVLFIKLDRKGLKYLYYLPGALFYSIRNTWFLKLN